MTSAPPMSFGKFTIRFLREQWNPFYYDRTLEIRNSAVIDGPNIRTIHQYHIYDWGDSKIPSEENYCNLLKILDIMNTHIKEKESPILVHCSAGIGRTGCLIVLSEICRFFSDLKSSSPE